MNTINQDAFISYLHSETVYDLDKVIIKLEKNFSINYGEIKFHKSITNCIFQCENFVITSQYQFYNNQLNNSGKFNLHFENCDLNIRKFEISYSYFSSLFFINNKSPKEIIFHSSDIKALTISKINNENTELKFFNFKSTIFSFKNLKIKLIHFSENCKINYQLLISNVISPEFKIYNSSIKNLDFKKNKINFLIFSENDFQKCQILYNEIGQEVKFKNTSFEDIFEMKKNYHSKNINISECNFKNHSFFDNNEFENLSIQTSSFNEIVSFKNTKLKSIHLESISFKHIAFFDNLSIKKINECNIETIRIIKQQFQKTDNLIAFYKFKSIELNKYRNNLKQNKKYWFNDGNAFILMIGYLFSNNGTNWIKALKMTLFTSFIFYSLFYLLFFFISVNNFKITSIEIKEFESFINGYLIYLIPTNLYNPLLRSKTFVTNLEWIPFILGKILIATGVYETIKSFRKFKN